MSYRTLIAAAALAFFATLPAIADEPLGSLHVSQTAVLANGEAHVTLSDTSALFFDGDWVETAADGRAMLEMSRGLIGFGTSTSASAKRTDRGYSLELSQGHLEIQLDATLDCEIATRDFIVRSGDIRPVARGSRIEMRVRAQVDGQVRVESVRGVLAIADRHGRVLERVGSGDATTLIARRAPEVPRAEGETPVPAASPVDPLIGTRLLGLGAGVGVAGAGVAVADHNDDDNDGSAQ